MTRTTRPFNLAYQMQMHVDCMLRQARLRHWKADATEIRRDVARLLKSGQAWLFHEPVQLELFDHA